MRSMAMAMWMALALVAVADPFSPQGDFISTRQAASSNESSACQPLTFSSILPSGGLVNFTQTIPANGTFVDSTDNGGSPRTAPNLPPLCVVKFTVPSSHASSFDFALFLPDQWNNRFMATGNGGFGGFIAWPDMGAFSHYGFATMSTNTGHYSSASDASWALMQPEKQIDWGYRAMHESVMLAKQAIDAYYNQNSSFNYYSGCSTGGRQGLKELTMFPEDFDGIIAGAPAWWTTHLQPWTAQVALANLPSSSPGHISAALFETILNEIVKQCDPQDGLADGIISDPYGCHFIPEKLLCSGPTNESACLTSPQLATLYHALNDWVDVNQTFVFPRLALGADLSALVGVTSEPNALGLTYIENFVLNTTDYDWHTLDYRIVQLADARDAGHPTVNYDVEQYRAQGGKLIQYQGWADQLIPTGSSIYWHSQVQQSLVYQGLDIDSWYRLFLIPGMQHCTGTVTGAPWYIAAANQELPGSPYSVPGFMDAEHDVTLAMMDWVERDIAPDGIIATKWNNDNVADGVEIQRPVCPYPQQARYSGSGNTSLPDNWSCQDL